MSSANPPPQPDSVDNPYSAPATETPLPPQKGFKPEHVLAVGLTAAMMLCYVFFLMLPFLVEIILDGNWAALVLGGGALIVLVSLAVMLFSWILARRAVTQRVRLETEDADP